MSDCKLPPSTQGRVTNLTTPCVLFYTLDHNKGNVCYAMNLLNGGPPAPNCVQVNNFQTKKRGQEHSLTGMSCLKNKVGARNVVLKSKTSLLLKFNKLSGGKTSPKVNDWYFLSN